MLIERGQEAYKYSRASLKQSGTALAHQSSQGRRSRSGVTADPIPPKIRSGRIRYASGFDPTSADSIRGINGAVWFLLSTSHSERCYTVNIHADLT